MSNRKKIVSIIGILIYICVILIALMNKINQELREYLPETTENNEYLTVGDPTVYGTDGNVEFSAFFLKDINRDGKEEQLLETFNDSESELDLYTHDGYSYTKDTYKGRIEPFYIKFKGSERLKNIKIVINSHDSYHLNLANLGGGFWTGSGITSSTTIFFNGSKSTSSSFELTVAIISLASNFSKAL